MAIFISKKDKKIGDFVAKSLAEEMDISVSEMMSKSKEDRVVKVRFMAWFVLHNIHEIRISAIAQMYNKHRATIANGVLKVNGSNLRDLIPKRLLSPSG